MCNLTEEEKNNLIPEAERSKASAKDFWYAKRGYCIKTCTKCTELQILKKILWETRKQNEGIS